MSHRFLRYVFLSTLMVAATMRLWAQPCADTQPVIAGPQVVSNNQLGVIYSTPNIPGHTYTWTVTGGNVTSGAGTSQITVAWGNVGTGTVSVLESNPAVPCSTTVSKSVSVRPLLISYLYYTNTSCYGDLISFFDASVADPANPIVSWDWNFGDGGTSTLQNPQHQYLPPYDVTYPIRLIVTNQGGQKDTIYDAVYVNPNQFIPTARFTSTIPNCLYEPVVFNSTTSTTPLGTDPIINWTWSFGDPSTGTSNASTLQNPTHVFSAPGTYNVNLEITNNKYCRHQVAHTITIEPSVPTSAFSYSSPTCLNNPVDFTNASTSPVGHDINTWIWYFGDNSSPVVVNSPASPDITHYFPGLGPYPVKLKVINNLGCRDSIYHNVQLDPSPLADFSYVMKCLGDSVPFTDKTLYNGGPAVATWHWDFGDPASAYNQSTAKNPKHVFTSTGTYTVTLVTTNTSGCPDTVQKQVTVFPKPGVEYTWNIGAQNNQIDFHVDSVVTPIGMIGNMMVWNFGDGTFGYGHNPSHIYPAPGTFNVTLTVTDTIGCSNSVTHVVGAPALPVAFFSSTSPSCLGTATCFEDHSTCPTAPFGWVTQWIWNFGDGTPNDTINFPDNPNICHTYATVDTFAVTLKIIDNNGYSAEYTSNVIILPVPVANFIYATTCEDAPVQFTDMSAPNGGGNIVSWDWDFGDPGSGINNTSGLQNPQHTFSGGGLTYNVRLIVVNFNNCRDTIIKPVYVRPAPPVDFTHDTACLQQLVHFYADTVVTQLDSIVTWSWDFGDGTPSVTDPANTSHLYTAAGVYTVTLTVMDRNGCYNTVAHTVEVNPLPIPNFVWNAPNCQGGPVQFTDQSTVPNLFAGYVARWYYDFGDGTNSGMITIPTSPNISHIFQGNSLVYTVTLTVWTNDSCTQSITKTVNLIPAPVANFEFSQTLCAGQTVNFTDLSQPNGGGNVVQWSWNFGDPGSGVNNTASIANPSHTFSAAGSYNVRLVVFNGNNCNDTIFKTVDINLLPVANFTADSACFGSITTFTDISIPNALNPNLTYSWDFGDGSPPSPLPNPTHLYTTYGWKTVKLTITNANGCIKDTTKLVLVQPLPVPEFSFSSPNCLGAPMQFTDMSTTVAGFPGQIVTWQWDFGDGTVVPPINWPATPNITHIYTGSITQHTVRLTVTTDHGCVKFIEHVVNSIPKPLANFSFPVTSCMSQQVAFTDLTQTNGGGNIIGWSWNFGDPASGVNNLSNAQNPVHQFTTFGTFNVRLIATNASGCVDTIVKSVIISQLPVANFNADTVCKGVATSFTDTSVPFATSIVTYDWDFGDGQPHSSLPNPTHTYATYGWKTVTLTVTNSNGCVKDTSKQILVRPLPIAEFSFTNPNCLGSAVQYTDNSTTVAGFPAYIQTWQWDFGDGTTTPPITFPASGSISHVFAGTSTTHTVTLTVTTNQGCSHTVSHVVNSIPKPIANFSFPTTGCASQATQFTDGTQTNGGGTIISWLWNFGDPASGINNSSTAQNPVHFFSAGGNFNVTLIVTNASGCSDTITKPITISNRPLANFSADTVCKGTITTFSNLSIPNTGSIASAFWEFGDGGTANTTNPTHLYGAAGIYNVKLTVTNSAGCVKDTTKQVLVLGEPVPQFSYQAPNCAQDSIQFTDLSTTPHGTIVTWEWDFGDGTTTPPINFPANQNIKHLFANGGTYNVSLTITTSDGCEKTRINQVQVGFKPVANFSSATSNCALVDVQFTDLSQLNGGPAITSWEWNFGDPTSGAANTSTIQDPLHAFTAGGTYSVHLLVHNANGCLDSITKTVTVAPAPVAAFSSDTACMNNLTHFTDASTTPTGSTIIAWNWNFGDPGSGSGNTSTLQNPTHTYTSSGVKTVTLQVTNSNQCLKDTVMQITVNAKPAANFTYMASCVGDSTQFNDLSLAPGSAITAWDWNFGDNTPHSTIQNPQHMYAAPGTYNVTLIVTNLAGCVDSVTQQVVARPKPTADYTYNAFFCPQGRVDFQDQSTASGAAIAERLWIFEPGANSTIPNPSYTFPVRDTTYAVTLIVTDTYGCMDTIVDSVYVKPGFLFTFINDTVCLGNTTHFHTVNQTPGDSLYSLLWNFGEPASGPANTSTLRNPMHTYMQPGSYVVKLRAYNSDNCVDSVFKQVTVYDLPRPLFSYQSTPCDSTIHFTDSTLYIGAGSITKWTWKFGDGSAPVVINGPGPGDTSHLYVNAGTYQVTLVIENASGCVDSVTRSVKRYPCIQALYAYQDTLRCARYSIAFADSSLPTALINQWHWNWGDGTDTTYTAHANPVTHTYPDAGTYSVTLRINAAISGTTIRDSITQLVVVHPTPLTAFSNVPVCLNQVTLFQDTTNHYGGGISTWNWNFGDPASGGGNTSTLKNPNHKFDTAGTYGVKLVTMNRFGCKDSLTKTTRVYGLPVAKFDNTPACQGDPTYFTDASLASDTTLGYWQWNFGDPSTPMDTSSLQDPSWRYYATGSYMVNFIVKDNFGCMDTIDSTVVVNVTPVSAFTLVNNFEGKQGQVRLDNVTTGASGYLWDFGNGKTSVEENPVITYSEDGTYVIKLISTNEFDCADTTFYEYKLLFKGLYVPNAFSPTNNSLGVRLFKPIGINLKQYHVTVFDPWGHLVWESVALDSQGRPSEGWDGTYEGELMTQGNYFWKITATFVDDTPWTGGDIGQGDYTTMGSVTLIR